MHLFLIWHGLWPLCEVTQASHKILMFAFFILWKATDQSLEEFGMLASETGGELVEWGSYVHVSVGDFFPQSLAKVPVVASSPSQCSQCFWSLSIKGFIFQEPWQGLQFPHAYNNFFVIFCLLTWVRGAFSPVHCGDHVLRVLCFHSICSEKNQALQYSFSSIKTWFFNVRINYFYITELQFADLILSYFPFELSRPQ